MAKKDRRGVPSKEELVELAHERGGRISSRALSRELGLTGGAKAELKSRVRELRQSGMIASRQPGGRRERGGLPPMAVVDVTEIDEDGEVWGESRSLPGTALLVLGPDGGEPSLAPGDRFLGRLRPDETGERIEARLFRPLPRAPKEIVGVLEAGTDGMVLRSTRRDSDREWQVAASDGAELEAGLVVRAEIEPAKPLARPRARIVESLGRAEDPRAVSYGIAAELELPERFPDEALALAEAAEPVALGRREDLRHLDLVTIDGADARDFDDAVWAEADSAADNPGGFRGIVAIADVAHYVRHGNALDQAARERGNSVYFPDRVIPMLPEALSNELCSLKPEVDRACVAVEMRIDAQGQLRDWRFMRGLMRSRARLTYEQVQAAAEGDPDEATGALRERVIAPLFALHAVLAEARRRRGTIELEMPERQVVFGEDGRVAGIVRRDRLPSHQLIEEMMIAANVAAARSLADNRAPCLYRVHDKPDPIKLEALAEYLERLGIPWSRTGKQPGDFTRLLEGIEEAGLREQVAGFVLRSQAQAVYQPENIGHFGLNLRRYAHFTSPIRRYADLVVHRLLIHHLGLADDGAGRDYSHEALVQIGQEVSATERKAADAERQAHARLTALYMADKEGARFAGRITGVQRFGLFVVLDETGAEGLVPVSTLGDDAFRLDPHHHALVGERHGESFGLGDRVEVELVEADRVQGRLVFRIDSHAPAHATRLAQDAWKRGRPQHGRQKGRRKVRARR